MIADRPSAGRELRRRVPQADAEADAALQRRPIHPGPPQRRRVQGILHGQRKFHARRFVDRQHLLIF